MRFESPLNLEYKTLITQEMLKLGYLANNSVYTCIDHNDSVLKGYEDALDKVFILVSQCEQGKPVADYLEGPVCIKDFRRLA
jgi:glutamate-1-semialdehyde 2,1-aminomutase